MLKIQQATVTGDDWPTPCVVFSALEPHIVVVGTGYTGVNGLNSDQARELASALLEAADKLDWWSR